MLGTQYEMLRFAQHDIHEIWRIVTQSLKGEEGKLSYSCRLPVSLSPLSPSRSFTDNNLSLARKHCRISL
jgi:hypothetical protein